MKFTQDQFSYMEEQFQNLTEQEKETLRRLVRSDLGRIVGKLMGPDFISFMGLLKAPKRGIAAPR
jgi:hypothetical protein